MPKRAVRDALEYCLAVVLEEFRNAGKIELYEFEFMSNHYHLLGRDLIGCLPDFMERLNSLIAREIDSIHGINGTCIEKGYGLVKLVGAQRIVKQAVYTLANPVSAFLVAMPRHWRSVSSRELE